MAKKLLDFRYTFGYLYLSYFSQRANTCIFLLNQVEYHFVIFVIVYLLHAAVMQHSTSANSIFTIGKKLSQKWHVSEFLHFWHTRLFVDIQYVCLVTGLSLLEPFLPIVYIATFWAKLKVCIAAASLGSQQRSCSIFVIATSPMRTRLRWRRTFR